MTTKKTRKRAAKPKPPAEELMEVAEPKPVEGQGPTVPLPFEPRPFGSKIALPADGTLLRKDGEPTVYVMREGQRRPFTSPEAFTDCGFGWGDIVVLPPEEIEPIPVGQDVTGASDL